jgi:hypothetical protein
VRYEFITPNNAHYLNISPLIYSHTGDKTLQMKAWVDNMELYPFVSQATPSATGIRYIRDHSNGSNKNTWNIWVEIEALERETGINIAL